MNQPGHSDQLTHSPTGRLRVGTDGRRHLQRPNGQPVAPTPGCREAVLVNVYDLHWTNCMTKRLRLAAYHSGVQLHGVEVAYGDSGVYTMTPKDVNSMETKMAYKKSVKLGFTSYSREDALLIGRWLGRSVFSPAMYDLLRRNCNHFSAALGRLLCPHEKFPTWINSLASVSTRLPFIERSIRHFTEADGCGEEELEDGEAPVSDSAKRRGLRAVCANLSGSLASASSSSSSSSSSCCSGGVQKN